jgi:hypothetical protein
VAHVTILFSFHTYEPFSLIRPFLRHTPGTLDNEFFKSTRSPGEILNKMVERHISASAVIANPSLPSAQTARDIHRTLSNEAVNQGFHNIVKELGQVEKVVGIDPLQNVPKLNPVYSHPVCSLLPKGLLYSQ